jgi:hypothetical protein
MMTSDELNARNKEVRKGFVGRLLGMYTQDDGISKGDYRNGDKVYNTKTNRTGTYIAPHPDMKDHHQVKTGGAMTSVHDKDLEFHKSDDNDLEKGGEGARGGKVIGHTKSGKPIYNNADHPAHKDFNSADHRDASIIHEDNREKYASSKSDSGFEKFMHHKDQFDQHEAAEKHESDKETKQGFDHHRKMAGYHEGKEKELWDEQQDLRSSSDKSLHKYADEKEPKRKYHSERAEHHLKTAHKLHDPVKHGNWNSTIPSHDDAMSYGEKHA